jgi:SAM-dependent methyltransferase
MMATAAEQMDRIVTAHSEGGGVSWNSYGQGMRESQADMNRPFFENILPEVFRELPRTHELLSRPGARLADVGCGAGWSTIALAHTYPNLSLTGFDIDTAAIEMAQEEAHRQGLDDRLSFRSVDIVAGSPDEDFDVVTAFECIHDMPQPVPVLTAMRELATHDGVVIVMDEAVGDEFTGNGDDTERLMYGFSLLVCLPDSLSTPASVGTGTVMRPKTLRRYATEAGFADVLVRGESGFFRFYELIR